MNIANALGMDCSAQFLYGANAIEIPINFILQQTGNDENKVAGVFQSSMGKALTYGGFQTGRPHVLVMGQMMFRPLVIVDTDRLIGQGIGNIYMNGFIPENWQESEPRLLVKQAKVEWCKS